MRQKRAASTSLFTAEIDYMTGDAIGMIVRHLRKLVPRAQIIRIEAIEFTDEPEPGHHYNESCCCTPCRNYRESHPEWEACKR